jgi:hypothetical protein
LAGTQFDTTRIRFGDMIAAGAGLLLLISLFLKWYKVSAEGLVDVSASVSGWEALGFIDILLFLIAIIAIAVAVARAANVMPSLPVSTGLLILGLGVIALLLVLFRLLSIPDEGAGDLPGVDVGRSFGIFVALIAAIGVTVGGWLGWNEEGRPSPGAAGTGAGAGPLGAGAQQPGGPAQPPQQEYAQPPAAATTPPAQATGGQAGSWPPPAGGAADWYPDPSGQKRLRYWDGSAWTDHTAD